jgi:TPR repeat protein
VFGRRRKRQEQQRETGGPQVSISALPSQTAARQAAAGGSPTDMNRLGTRLKLEGRDDEAAKWFRKAAEAGNNDAMANLATYLMARGRNSEAAEWFRRAGGPLGEALAQRLSELPDTPRDR